MVKVLLKLFIKDVQNINDEKVRGMYGTICGFVGIFLNLCLFVMKFIVGIIYQSVAIEADAFNNLSDALSSIVTIISFKLSLRPADKEHPFGHARYEWLASLFLAMMIFLLGFELAKSGIEKIIHPSDIVFDKLAFVILCISIVVKFYMFLYNRKYGKLVNSSVLMATSVDSLSDVLSTSAIVFSLVMSYFIGYNLDGIAGFIVACFIFKSGWDILKEALDSLLGSAPDEKVVKEVEDIILSHQGIIGIHDLMIHNYGYGKLFASVHVEMDSKYELMKAHAIVDHIEREIKAVLKMEIIMHIDPILVDDPVCNELKKWMIDELLYLDENLSLHDFQVFSNDTKIVIAFDIKMVEKMKLSQAEILNYLNKVVKKEHENYELLINFDI